MTAEEIRALPVGTDGDRNVLLREIAAQLAEIDATLGSILHVLDSK